MEPIEERKWVPAHPEPRTEPGLPFQLTVATISLGVGGGAVMLYIQFLVPYWPYYLFLNLAQSAHECRCVGGVIFTVVAMLCAASMLALRTTWVRRRQDELRAKYLETEPGRLLETEPGKLLETEPGKLLKDHQTDA